MFQNLTHYKECIDLEETLDRRSLRIYAPRPLWFHLNSLKNNTELDDSSKLIPINSKIDETTYNNITNGIDNWRNHSWQRKPRLTRMKLKCGASLLFDKNCWNKKQKSILLVPSLINDWTIFDLHPNQSFYSHILKSTSYFPIILDWGKTEPNFNLQDYCNTRLIPALEEIYKITGYSSILLGYCLGGLFCLLAAQNSILCKSLILVATPWDFHKGYDFLALGHFGLFAEPIIETNNLLPADWLALIFALLNPKTTLEKYYRSWGKNVFHDELFVATEDWLNTGQSLGKKIAKQIIWDLFIDNSLYNNNKSAFVSKIINTVKIPHKTLLIIPDKDKIVPKQSALSLANYLKHTVVLNIYEGHIGLMSSANAPTRSWNLISKMINCHL